MPAFSGAPDDFVAFAETADDFCSDCCSFMTALQWADD
jgi:hypothetical protein